MANKTSNDTALVVVSVVIEWPDGDVSRINTHVYLSRVMLEVHKLDTPELIGYEAGKAITRELAVLLEALDDDRPI